MNAKLAAMTPAILSVVKECYRLTYVKDDNFSKSFLFDCIKGEIRPLLHQMAYRGIITEEEISKLQEG